MTKTIIHVNQHVIKKNVKTGSRDPVFTVKRGRQNVYCHAVKILGQSLLIYRPDKPLNCGARVWLETTEDVLMFNASWNPRTGKADLTAVNFPPAEPRSMVCETSPARRGRPIFRSSKRRSSRSASRARTSVSRRP